MYIFGLQKVLDYRKTQEKEEQRRLHQAHLATNAAREQLVRLKADLCKMHEDYSLIQSSRVDIPSAVLACDYAAHLAQRIREGEEAVAQLEERLRTQVSQTEKAMQDRKVMATLRDNGLARYRHEALLEEQRQNDEMAKFIYLRKS